MRGEEKVCDERQENYSNKSSKVEMPRLFSRTAQRDKVMLHRRLCLISLPLWQESKQKGHRQFQGCFLQEISDSTNDFLVKYVKEETYP